MLQFKAGKRLVVRLYHLMLHAMSYFVMSNCVFFSVFRVQLFASTDLGRKWTLLQERVTKDKVFWSVQLYSLIIDESAVFFIDTYMCKAATHGSVEST